MRIDRKKMKNEEDGEKRKKKKSIKGRMKIERKKLQ